MCASNSVFQHVVVGYVFVSACVCVCVKQLSSTCGGRIRVCECVCVCASNSVVQHVVVGYVFVSTCV